MALLGSKRSITKILCPKCNHRKAWVHSGFYRCTRCSCEFTKADVERKEKEFKDSWK